MTAPIENNELREQMLATMSVVGLDNDRDGEPDLWQIDVGGLQKLMQLINAHTARKEIEARLDGAMHMHKKYFPDCEGGCELMEKIAAELQTLNETKEEE